MREPSPLMNDRGLPARATREELARRASLAALYDVAITDSSYRLQRHEAHTSLAKDRGPSTAQDQPTRSSQAGQS